MAAHPDVDKPRASNVLRSNELLSVLTDQETSGIAAISRLARAEKGEVLWLNGADVDYMGLSCDGFVKMVRSNPSGMEVTVELVGPGHLFGLMGMLTGCGCPLNAIAISDLYYLRIPKGGFMAIYAESMPLKDRLVQQASRRLCGAVDMAARMCSDRVDERIAAVLFVLAESYGRRQPDGMHIEVPLTRQEIGAMAGTTMESAIRVMSRWQREGIVFTDHQRTVIRDEGRLADVVNHRMSAA